MLKELEMNQKSVSVNYAVLNRKIPVTATCVIKKAIIPKNDYSMKTG